MIESVIDAGLEPFKHTIGWQAFAYGVAGKLVLKKSKTMINGFRTPDAQGSSGDDEQESKE